MSAKRCQTMPNLISHNLSRLILQKCPLPLQVGRLDSSLQRDVLVLGLAAYGAPTLSSYFGLQAPQPPCPRRPIFEAHPKWTKPESEGFPSLFRKTPWAAKQARTMIQTNNFALRLLRQMCSVSMCEIWHSACRLLSDSFRLAESLPTAATSCMMCLVFGGIKSYPAKPPQESIHIGTFVQRLSNERTQHASRKIITVTMGRTNGNRPIP